MLLATVSCTAAGQILMKKGINQLDALSLSLSLGRVLATPQIVIGGICYILGFVIWLNVLKILPLSVAYPSSSIVYVIVIILSAFLLGEAITPLKIAGMLLVCGGVVCIGLS